MVRRCCKLFKMPRFTSANIVATPFSFATFSKFVCCKRIRLPVSSSVPPSMQKCISNPLIYKLFPYDKSYISVPRFWFRFWVAWRGCLRAQVTCCGNTATPPCFKGTTNTFSRLLTSRFAAFNKSCTCWCVNRNFLHPMSSFKRLQKEGHTISLTHMLPWTHKPPKISWISRRCCVAVAIAFREA